MLQARSERPAASLWVPGMSPGAMDAGSARAQEIARKREELLGMLHDLPESEYELSLTDLVEEAGGEAATAPAPSEGKEPGPAARSLSGRQVQQQQAAAGRPERRRSARRRDSGSASSFRSSSDGVLLNFYMPRSLTRSFTAPRPGRTPSVSSECSKRERDTDAETVKCWSLLWDRRWCKSGRRDPGAPPNESTIRAASAAILKAAKHSASPAKI
ncbi:uncharacterized protein LOC133911472 [Phragmites australis]|uniref:uncharacterized protein LOC133911472 n=1 Tax=Phragmites australis TaxID=29695 RepID=UPI002D786369|nr:uncharacterized protein LOC133911472 [Phragmites australis]